MGKFGLGGGPQGGGGMPGGGMLGNGGAGLEQFFGPLVNQANGLQRQATGGIEQFLNQPAPEQRAMDVSMPALQGILNGAPGAGIMDALKPRFEQNLAAANQQGGRFGSGNAILRSRAVDDFNLLGAQAAQQGQQTQLQAAQMLNMLASSAGQNPFNRLMGAFGVGQQSFQNADLETQRRLQLLGGLLGTQMGLAFNQPVLNTKPASPGAGQQVMTLVGNWLGGGGGNPFGGGGG